MKIALCSTFVPFVFGGARNIVEWLEFNLKQAGHEVERVYLPEVDVPELLFRQMTAFRAIDLESADRIVCFRPQSHLIPHRHKILWFIHHIRVFYDMWDTEYRGMPDDPKHRGIRAALHAADTAALMEAKKVFTNSKVVSNRLRTYNNVASEVLYPPVFQPERFSCADYGDEIVCICRLEHHKRQHLLVEAMAHTQSPVRLRLCGANLGQAYADELRQLVQKFGIQDRVELDIRWISEDEKVDILSKCLAAAYIPLDEDSYGYPSLEACHSEKCILTTTDAGGVLELVNDGEHGFVCEPNAKSLAQAMDRLFLDKAKAKAMGKNAAERVAELKIGWDNVVRRLLE